MSLSQCHTRVPFMSCYSNTIIEYHDNFTKSCSMFKFVTLDYLWRRVVCVEVGLIVLVPFILAIILAIILLLFLSRNQRRTKSYEVQVKYIDLLAPMISIHKPCPEFDTLTTWKGWNLHIPGGNYMSK